MDSATFARVRKRIYLTLPWIGALMVAYGITSEGTAALWVGLLGAAVGPAHGALAAAHVPKPERPRNE